MEKAEKFSVEIWEEVVKTLLPLLRLCHRHHLRVRQEPVQDAPRAAVGGGWGVQGVAKIEADVRVEGEPYGRGVGLFFKGRGGEGEGEGEGGRGGLWLMGEMSANKAAHTTVKAGALPQGVKSFDDNPGSELLLFTVLAPCSCC